MHELEEEFRVIEVGGLIENCVDDIQESVDVVGQERLRAGRLPISRLEQELWIARFLVLPNGTGAGIDNFHQEPSYDSIGVLKQYLLQKLHARYGLNEPLAKGQVQLRVLEEEL